MKRLMFSVALALVCVAPGCAVRPAPVPAPAASATRVPPAALANPASSVRLCQLKECDPGSTPVGAEIAVEKNAPLVEGHPLTAVVVTQCNLVVAVYMTMPDGRLLRFDQTANVPAEQLVSIAYTATRSERVEVSCEGNGAVGYEKHGPV